MIASIAGWPESVRYFGYLDCSKIRFIVRVFLPLGCPTGLPEAVCFRDFAWHFCGWGPTESWNHYPLASIPPWQTVSAQFRVGAGACFSSWTESPVRSPALPVCWLLPDTVGGDHTGRKLVAWLPTSLWPSSLKKLGELRLAVAISFYGATVEFFNSL